MTAPLLFFMPLRTGPLVASAALAGGVLVGCSTRARPPAPAPTPASTAPAPATPAAIPAPSTAASRFAFLPGPASYDVRTESSIEMTVGPEAERGRERSTLGARVRYDFGATPGATGAQAGRGSLAVSGEVEELTMDASARIGGPTPPPAEPVRFQGTVDARGARLELRGAVFGCVGPAGTAQAAGIAAAREAVLFVPSSIAVAARWRDSVTVTACRGPVPATVTSVARYEITAVDGNRVQLRRETTVRLRGQAIAGGRTIALLGSGAGTATLELDAARGRLTRIDGETRATITVTLPDGARTFAQVTKTSVTARP